MPAIAPIKILKPKVKPRKNPVIDANKIEKIKVIPKIVNSVGYENNQITFTDEIIEFIIFRGVQISFLFRNI